MSSADRAELLDRLLRDAGFRARFRHDPAAAARDAGFPDVAAELDAHGTQALEPLERRESRSSIAGVMVAAAVEGLGLFALSEQIGPDDALAAERPPHDDAVATPSAFEAQDEADASEEQLDDGASAGEESDESDADQEDESDEADEIDEDEEDEDEEDENEEDEDDQADEADGFDEVEGGDSGGNSDSGDDAAEGRDTEESGDATSGRPQATGDWRPDPAQYGVAGGGGPRSPIDAAILRDDDITLDADGKKDFAAGRMDPRIGEVLLRLAEKHTITISATTSDHPQNTAGGSPSNHWYGRAIDIATVDGEIVRPGSGASRKLAAELQGLQASIRPTEVGSPWAISAPGFFTDAAHQDHIHVAFDDAVASTWKPPNETRVMRALPDPDDGG